MMVDSNLLLVQTPEKELASLSTPLSRQEAQENIAFLRTQVESWLAVLFNVYGSVGRDSRSLIGEVINSWTSIAGTQVSRTSLSDVMPFNAVNRKYTAHILKLCSYSKRTCQQPRKPLLERIQMETSAT